MQQSPNFISTSSPVKCPTDTDVKLLDAHVLLQVCGDRGQGENTHTTEWLRRVNVLLL